jgi:hypothetical protein
LKVVVQQLDQGKAYFFLSYADERMRIPLIETYIYLGSNLREESSAEQVRYFKEPDRFLQTGQTLDDRDLAHCILVGDDTAELILDARGLINALQGHASKDD